MDEPAEEEGVYFHEVVFHQKMDKSCTVGYTLGGTYDVGEVVAYRGWTRGHADWEVRDAAGAVVRRLIKVAFALVGAEYNSPRPAPGTMNWVEVKKPIGVPGIVAPAGGRVVLTSVVYDEALISDSSGIAKVAVYDGPAIIQPPM